MSALKLFLFPPLAVFVLLAIGYGLRRLGRRRAGGVVIALALLALYVLSTPAAGTLAGLGLDIHPAISPEEPVPRADAIVVLAAGRRSNSAAYGGDTVGPLTLERLRYAAFLNERSGIPILVTGGLADEDHPSLAELMRRTLEEDYGTSPRWLEDEARNTAQNAIYSAEILQAEGIERVLVVTHAWHMRRAVYAFEIAGLEPIPAPMAVNAHEFRWQFRIVDFMPSPWALADTCYVMHEWLGLVWYWLRYDEG
jgi:uncharacterized SAM-binding protein YcdF (DUF218 family)